MHFAQLLKEWININLYEKTLFGFEKLLVYYWTLFYENFCYLVTNKVNSKHYSILKRKRGPKELKTMTNLGN